MAFFVILTFVFLTLYAALQSLLFKGLTNVFKAEKVFEKKQKAKNTFSIICAARNEAGNIKNLISDLQGLDYPREKFEFILIDDQSDDDTKEKALQALGDSELDYKILDGKGGKKSSLWKGINEAKNEYVVFTDADCRLPAAWLKTYDTMFSKGDYKILSAPVFFEERNFLSQLFALEFASLTASGAGALGAGFPLMANGANLAARKDFLREAREIYSSGEPSGDDVFLLIKAFEKYGAKGAGFIPAGDALVLTEAPASLAAFFNQRIRWTKKSKHYRNPFIIGSALTVFLLALTMAILPFVSFVAGFKALLWFAVAASLKTLIDSPLMFVYLKKFEKTKLLRWLFPLQFVYPFYIVITALLSFAGASYEWKGRKA